MLTGACQSDWPKETQGMLTKHSRATTSQKFASEPSELLRSCSRRGKCTECGRLALLLGWQVCRTKFGRIFLFELRVSYENASKLAPKMFRLHFVG